MAAKRTRRKQTRSIANDKRDIRPALRVVGGRLRGRPLLYDGDQRTRPMKDRTREALFSLLGDTIRGAHIFDLFAGTGAVGIEALSRGAARATFIERHAPTAKKIQQNLIRLSVVESAEVLTANTFFWAKGLEKAVQSPWVAFCCPPYSFYEERADEMGTLVDQLVGITPRASAIVVEGNQGLSREDLPRSECWQIREYPPAVLAIFWPPDDE